MRKRYPGYWFNVVIHFLEGTVGFGLISGAALAALVGQLMLSAILALLAIGVFLRFKRGRMRKQQRDP